MLQLPLCELDRKTAQVLENYFWPGNVRELSNAIERAVNLAKGRIITIEHLPESLQSLSEPLTKPKNNVSSMGELEKTLIIETLEKAGWNITHCASALGIARNTLYRKLRTYHIAIPSA